VVEQTRRHSIISSLLGIPHVVVAINKIDLVNYSQDVYNNIVIEYSKLAQQLGIENITYFPLSALNGDNIVEKSLQTPWYEGKPLLEFLEEVKIENAVNHTDTRFQVQYVIRPQTEALHDYRGYAGKITSGIYKKGDKVKVLPAGIETTIDKIEIAGIEVEEAFAPQSVTLLLTDDIDISRGDAIIKSTEAITANNEADVLFCWLDDKPLQNGNKYLLQHNNRSVRTVIKNLAYKIDVNSLDHIEDVQQVKLNEIVRASIKTAAPIVFDAYKKNRSNGAAILIDETSNATVAAVLFQ
jgi:sulfate adenylyltransferase subunit 1